MADNYYGQIDETMKKQVDEALKDVDAQEQLALQRLAMRRNELRGLSQEQMNSAYTQYRTAIDPYGVNSENLYASGLASSGRAETARSDYFAAYTDLLGRIQASQAQTEAELDMETREAMGEAAGLRTDINVNAYNNMLDEMRRRADAEWEKEKYADTLSRYQRDYELKLMQAEYQREKDERDYALKLESEQFDRDLALKNLAAKAYGGSSSGSTKSKSKTKESEKEETSEESPYEMLVRVFESLNQSVLPGEDNPSIRIRAAKSSYLDVFKDLLSKEEYGRLERM